MAAYLNAGGEINYANILLAQIQGASRKGILGLVNQTAEIPQNSMSGLITVPITTKVSMNTPADGTARTNNGAVTLQTLAFLNGIHTIKLFDSELAQFTPQRMAMETVAAGDAAVVQAQDALLVDYMGGTSDFVQTLTAGQNNFFTDGTDSEIRANLRILDNAIGHVLAITGQNFDDIFIAVPNVAVPTTKSNPWSNIWNLVQTTQLLQRDSKDGLWRYKDVVLVGVNSTATGWGKWDQGTAAIVAHRDSAAVAFNGVKITPARPADDGLTQIDWKTSHAEGLIQDTWAEIMNPAT